MRRSSRRATRATFNPGTVDVVVYPPIPVDDWTIDNLADKIAEVRQLYLDTLKDWPHESSSEDRAVCARRGRCQEDAGEEDRGKEGRRQEGAAKKAPAKKTAAKKATQGNGREDAGEEGGRQEGNRQEGAAKKGRP